MKSAFYHQTGKPPKLLQVLKENTDGTFDLGDEKGNLLVGSCRVGDQPSPGLCTVDLAAEKAAAEKAAAEKAAAEKAAAEKAAAEKAAAEKAAAGKPAK